MSETTVSELLEEAADVLSRRQGFARVWRCRPGCVHVDLKRFSFRLEEEELQLLGEMLDEARESLRRSQAADPPGIH